MDIFATLSGGAVTPLAGLLGPAMPNTEFPSDALFANALLSIDAAAAPAGAPIPQTTPVSTPTQPALPARIELPAAPYADIELSVLGQAHPAGPPPAPINKAATLLASTALAEPAPVPVQAIAAAPTPLELAQPPEPTQVSSTGILAPMSPSEEAATPPRAPPPPTLERIVAAPAAKLPGGDAPEDRQAPPPEPAPPPEVTVTAEAPVPLPLQAPPPPDRTPALASPHAEVQAQPIARAETQELSPVITTPVPQDTAPAPLPVARQEQHGAPWLGGQAPQAPAPASSLEPLARAAPLTPAQPGAQPDARPDALVSLETGSAPVPVRPEPTPAPPPQPPAVAAATTATATAAPAATAATPPPAPVTSPQPSLSMRSDRVGERMGVEIARRVAEGGDELTIRLDPAELGRISIRMRFDEGGSLRAVVSADSPMVAEAIRRDTAELARALGDAGVRTDGQSFRFDRGGTDGGSQPHQTPWQRHQNRSGGEGTNAFAPDDEPHQPAARPLGRLDLMA